MGAGGRVLNWPIEHASVMSNEFRGGSLAGSGMVPPTVQEEGPFPYTRGGDKMLVIRKHLKSMALLVLMGSFLTSLFVMLLTQHKVATVPMRTALPLWIPVVSGTGAILIAYTYPFMDALILERPLSSDRIPTWPDVVRALGVFLGVNYGASKLSYEYSVELALMMATLAVGLWYFFDRTWHGFILAVVVAIVGTASVRIIVSAGAYTFVKADFFGIRSWIPCVFFAAGVVFGAAGRRLSVHNGFIFGSKTKPS